jgi:hypothetical protein
MSTTASKSFGNQRARLPHLVRGTGGVAGEVSDLRGDIEEGFQAMENRTGYPELDFHDLTDGAVAAAGGDITLIGRNMLDSQTFDELVLWLTTSEIVITCLKPGDSGFTIEITDGATAGSEVVTKTGDDWEIQIQVGVSTANQIATAINLNAADSDGYLRAASGGAGVVNAIAAATAMAGGVGDFANNKIMVGGLEALPINTPGTAGAAAWTDTSVKVTSPAVGGAGDHAQITAEVNGARTQPLSAVLT